MCDSDKFFHKIETCAKNYKRKIKISSDMAVKYASDAMCKAQTILQNSSSDITIAIMKRHIRN